MTTTTAPPDLNTAAARLIEALDDVHDTASLREGFRRSIEFFGAFLVPTDPNHRDAAETIRVWSALDDLAAAVAARKEA